MSTIILCCAVAEEVLRRLAAELRWCENGGSWLSVAEEFNQYKQTICCN
ncbi:MAG: hypothetical protein U0X76_10535 [Bacteroidia bacterium]